MKKAARRILIIVAGAMAAVFVVSGGFWIVYGGYWQDYLKLGFVPFVVIVPSRIWNYSESLAFMIALLYWLVLLAIIYVVSALVSWSRLRHKNLAYIGLTASAMASIQDVTGLRFWLFKLSRVSTYRHSDIFDS